MSWKRCLQGWPSQACVLRQAPVRLLLKREPNLERDLPVTDFAVLDVSAGLGHLKPAHVVDGLFSARQRVFYRLFKSVG